MTREDLIAEIRRRVGRDLAWDEASDAELRQLLAELEESAVDPDGRFTDNVWAA